ncbi:two-component system, OmpR family, KDP operon response regulator KdpE [Fulvimarina manganoxydans]|uniref:Two-component system, OmpR family, KDP operon response regulator KdpE n=1 Tax=Fulvimarina manganoxydans TaxID=937218 RepID=A0A1W1ZF20_9HYPH|nr:response regulator [Fulvimarina manganoxydans]SMC47029.1 two-component system, OmpR family, KDP operon response regulator KdpE [Fulvimarina manganoxydans]
MIQPTILVVDDEPAIHRFLKPVLEAEGYRVVQALMASEALRSAMENPPDAIVLDLGLPDLDGKDVIRRLRKVSQVPIVVLSARDRETEKIQALDLGADDYVEKPFGVGELTARLRAALRHARQTLGNGGIMRCGTIEINVDAHQVRKAGAEIRLTRREFDVLVVLLREAGRVVTHRRLLKDVWGAANEGDTQYLRVYIGQLRQKLEDDPSAPRLIITEPGIGYRLVS